MATLQSLMQVRSQRANHLKAYLKKFEDTVTGDTDVAELVHRLTRRMFPKSASLSKGRIKFLHSAKCASLKAKTKLEARKHRIDDVRVKIPVRFSYSEFEETLSKTGALKEFLAGLGAAPSQHLTRTETVTAAILWTLKEDEMLGSEACLWLWRNWSVPMVRGPRLRVFLEWPADVHSSVSAIGEIPPGLQSSPVPRQLLAKHPVVSMVYDNVVPRTITIWPTPANIRPAWAAAAVSIAAVIGLVFALRGPLVASSVALQDGFWPPEIEVTSALPSGSGLDGRTVPVTGRFRGSPFREFRVVVYTFDGNTWWVQPTDDMPFATVAGDGTWSVDTRLGVRYVALLVGATFSRPPPTLTTSPQALPGVEASRVVEGQMGLE
ncbi:MAG: hypothetical protein HOP16_09805 [Acidobacteria bacterium]|nr:hypothetical protein [Acidobacteriota bacterium]